MSGRPAGEVCANSLSLATTSSEVADLPAQVTIRLIRADDNRAPRLRADALLLLAVWAVGTAIPRPTAVGLIRTHSESVPDLDNAVIDVPQRSPR